MRLTIAATQPFEHSRPARSGADGNRHPRRPQAQGGVSFFPRSEADEVKPSAVDPYHQHITGLIDTASGCGSAEVKSLGERLPTPFTASAVAEIFAA